MCVSEREKEIERKRERKREKERERAGFIDSIKTFSSVWAISVVCMCVCE